MARAALSLLCVVVAAVTAAFANPARARAHAANERSDEITDHGRNAIAEADAIAQALAPDP
jgi:hypothetical protein